MKSQNFASSSTNGSCGCHGNMPLAPSHRAVPRTITGTLHISSTLFPLPCLQGRQLSGRDIAGSFVEFPWRLFIETSKIPPFRWLAVTGAPGSREVTRADSSHLSDTAKYDGEHKRKGLCSPIVWPFRFVVVGVLARKGLVNLPLPIHHNNNAKIQQLSLFHK